MGSPKKRIQYRYDARGNRSALIDHDGGRFTYSYDTVGRMTQVLNPQGQPTTFSYDAGGRRILKKLSNGTRTSFSYDQASNLTGLFNLKNDGTVLSSFDYAYDKTGNRTRVVEGDGSRVTWSYDNTYQLTGEHRTGTTPYRDTYTYDAAGNRLLKNHDGARTTYAYDNANQLRYSQDVSGRTTFTFDADGNQQVQREPGGNRTTYTWDYENRLTGVKLPDATRATMAYEPEGLRVKAEESTGTKKFVWDEQNYLAELDASNDTQVTYTNEPRTYGRLISQRRGSTSHWYNFDAIGSTRQLTSAAAAVTDTRLFDAWGVQLSSSGSTVFPFGYVGVDGYYTDVAGTRLYVRARHLATTFGSWLSYDPLRFHTHALLYGYVNNSPLFWTDPSGLKCIVCGSLIQYRIDIDEADSVYSSRPHRRIADAVGKAVNGKLADYGLAYNLPFKHSGLYTVRRRTNSLASIDFLFFVVFDICESDDPPGTCRLFLDESETMTRLTDKDGVRTQGGEDKGDITDTHTLKAMRLRPAGQCNKAIVFGDMPSSTFEILFVAVSKKLRQRFEVRDSDTNEVVYTLNNSIDCSVDFNGQFLPKPDFRSFYEP